MTALTRHVPTGETPPTKFGILCAQIKQVWRNWHTRMTKDHVPHGLRVQISPPAFF